MGVKRRKQRGHGGEKDKKQRRGQGEVIHFFLWTLTSNGADIGKKKKHISAAYLPLPSPPTNKDEQLEDRKWSVDSGALCFHYGTPSWEPGELNDGDMDYPARTQCRV